MLTLISKTNLTLCPNIKEIYYKNRIFLLSNKNNIGIIDLNYTYINIKYFEKILLNTILNNKKILFISTMPETLGCLKYLTTVYNQYYITGKLPRYLITKFNNVLQSKDEIASINLNFKRLFSLPDTFFILNNSTKFNLIHETIKITQKQIPILTLNNLLLNFENSTYNIPVNMNNAEAIYSVFFLINNLLKKNLYTGLKKKYINLKIKNNKINLKLYNILRYRLNKKLKSKLKKKIKKNFKRKNILNFLKYFKNINKKKELKKIILGIIISPEEYLNLQQQKNYIKLFKKFKTYIKLSIKKKKNIKIKKFLKIQKNSKTL